MSDIFRRIGQFQITKELLANENQFDSMFALFGNFIILRCDYDVITNVFTYTAFNPNFDVVNEGEKIPMYDIIIDELNNVKIQKH
jgi:hypothetical protein